MCGLITIQIDSDGKRWITQDGVTIVVPKDSVDDFLSRFNNRPIRSHAKSFELFWNMYPKKSGKKPCSVKWNKIISEDESLADVIMKSLPEQMASEQWQKSGGMFIPMPSTWLNQERWNDVMAVNIQTVCEMTKGDW